MSLPGKAGRLLIRGLTAQEASGLLTDLIDLLRDAVEQGASVGFVQPFDQALAASYWRGQLSSVEAGKRLLLGAFQFERLVGTVQLDLCQHPNGSHRAEVQRLLVASDCYRQGIGARLMLAAECEAKKHDRSLLLLNTRAGDPSERLYRKLGYAPVGTVPDFARNPDGSFNTTIIMYHDLNIKKKYMKKPPIPIEMFL